MDSKLIIDKITKIIGDYIAQHANNNELMEKCENISAIDNVIESLKTTIDTIKNDDPILTTKLKEYKIKKEQEKDQLINVTMYDILPKPIKLASSDYGVNESEPNTLVLKDSAVKKDTLKDISDILKEMKAKKRLSRSSSPNYSSYSGGCGCSSYSSGGC